jgi:hypothetical protein
MGESDPTLPHYGLTRSKSEPGLLRQGLERSISGANFSGCYKIVLRAFIT